MQRWNHTKHPWRGALLLTLGLCLLPLASGFEENANPTAALPLVPDEGKKIYLKTCAACHGQDARGVPGLGKDLVAGAFTRQLSDEELVTFIERGRPADDSLNTTGVPMPPKGGNASLTRENLYAVVAYLRSFQEE